MSDYENLKEDISEIKDTVRDIFRILNGNGQNGLVTKVALNRNSVKRLWWFVGIGSTIFISGVGYLFAKVIG